MMSGANNKRSFSVNPNNMNHNIDKRNTHVVDRFTSAKGCAAQGAVDDIHSG